MFPKELIMKRQFASKFGELECLHGDNLSFCHQAHSYPYSTHARSGEVPAVHMRSYQYLHEYWIFFLENNASNSVIGQLDFYISDNLPREMLHFGLSFAECWNLDA
jgi:hypothetical protein